MTALVSCWLAVGVPHLARGADHRRHRRVDDHVARHVQVGDAAVGVDHREVGAASRRSPRSRPRSPRARPAGSVVERGQDARRGRCSGRRRALRARRRARSNTSAKKARTAWPKMIGSETFIIVAFRCSENSTPCSLASAICSARNASSARAAHHRARRRSRRPAPATDSLSTVTVPSLGDVLDPQRRRRRRSVTDCSVERKSPSPIVATCDLGVRRPGAHRVRVLAGVLLHRGRRAAVGVALAQHRVDRAALDRVVAPRGRRLLLVGLRVVRVVGDVVALRLQLLDRRLELRHRGADVRQLDDVGLGRLGQLAELGERVRHPLVLGQAVGELGEDAPGERDVARLDLDAGGARRTPRRSAGSECVASAGRLVGVGVDDLHMASDAEGTDRAAPPASQRVRCIVC